MPDIVPTAQFQKEYEYMAKLQQERAKANLAENAMISQEAYTHNDSSDQNQASPPAEKAVFPLGMFCGAVIFDLVGMIPIINFITEPVATLVFGFWQKTYAPKSNPLVTIMCAKLADLFLLGMLPSNIGVVIYAYTAKRFNLNAAKIAAEAAKGAMKGGVAGAAMEAGKKVVASKTG